MSRHDTYLLLKNSNRWLTTKEIVERSKYNASTISRHLCKLKREGLVIDERIMLFTIVKEGPNVGQKNISPSKMWKCIA